MTKIEVNNTLKLINKDYKSNAWLSFTDVAAIALDTSHNLYPSGYNNDFKNEYYFDDTNELLYERVVSTDVNNTYAVVTLVVGYASIAAIVKVSPENPYQMYKYHK